MSRRREVLSARCPVGENSRRQDVPSERCPVGEMSRRRDVPSARCPVGEKYRRRAVRRRVVTDPQKQILLVPNKIIRSTKQILLALNKILLAKSINFGSEKYIIEWPKVSGLGTQVFYLETKVFLVCACVVRTQLI
jgi:hypothetical protein